jgi:creatinine amidohydrolase/Fe(II)-dependent formamide hydrolase-like protein
MKYNLWDMSWMEAEETFNKSNIVILPTGTLHGNGPTTNSKKESTVKKIAEEVSKKTGVINLPVVTYGENEKQKYYPGSITISPETMVNFYVDIFTSLRRNGIEKVVVLNGHGGNRVSIEAAARKVRDIGILISILEWWSIGKERDQDLWNGDHSYLAELAVAMAIQGKDIADFRWKEIGYKGEWGDEYTTEKIFGEKIIPLGFNNFKFNDAKVLIPIQAWDIDLNGPPYIGEEMADELYQRGQEILKRAISYTVDFVEEFKKIDIRKALKSRDNF